MVFKDTKELLFIWGLISTELETKIKNSQNFVYSLPDYFVFIHF